MRGREVISLAEVRLRRLLSAYWKADAINQLTTDTAMRYKESFEQQTYMREASDAGNLQLLYSGLDVLGETPWVINREIFEVMLEVWNSG